MKKYLFIIVLLALSVAGWSQGTVLKGKVVDRNTNVPLQGATIRVGEETGTISDKDGAFSIECSGSMKFVVSYVGYESLTINNSDCTLDPVIGLVASNPMLSAVEITAVSTPSRSMLSQPISITKLGNAEIKRATGLFMDDAINANTPGVFMQRRTIGGGQNFNIRGYGGGGPGPRGINSNFDQQGIKAYLNGIPITDAEGITLMDDIDFGSIGNVEITKGPSGTLYGLAIAGVINLQTIKPAAGKTSVGQDVLVGSYGLNRFTTHLHVGTERSSLIITYGRQNFDGYMQHTKSYKDFVNVMGDFKLSDKQSLTTYFGYSNSYDQRNGELTEAQYITDDFSGNPAYIKNDAHSNVISFRAGIGHTYQFSDNIANTTSVFGTGMSNNAASAGGWTDKAPVNYGFRSVFDTKFSLKNSMVLSGVTGIEAQKQYAQTLGYPMVTNNADPTGYNIIGAIRSNQTSITGTYSIFTQWTLALPHDLSITAGVGTSSMDIQLIDKFYVAANNTPTNTVPTTYSMSYKNMVSPRFAVNKIINSHMSVYASYSQGYKAPVASSIYTPLAGTVNTSLRPENGKQFEVGTKGSLLKDRLIYEVAYFNAVYSDKMTLVGVPNAAGTATLYSYVVNSGKFENQGVEALVKYTAYQADNGLLRMVRPFANVTYSDFKYNGVTFQNNISTPPADYTGNPVAGVPRYTANGGVDFVTGPGVYGNVTYLWRDSMPYTPDGLSKALGFGLINAKAGYRKTIGHFDVDAYVGINNITGIRYYQMVFVNQLPDAYLAGPRNTNYFGGVNVKYTF